MDKHAMCAASNDEWCCVRPRLKNPSRTLCAGHAQQKLRGAPFAPLKYRSSPGKRVTGPCDFSGCPNRKKGSFYCPAHEMQKRRGTPLRSLKLWEPHETLAGWSKPWIEKRGYAWVSQKNGIKKPEHRVVMELMIGRELLPDENVHHINGVRHDNRPENLELWATLQPPGQRIEDKLAYAHEIIARYGSEKK